MRFLVMKKFFPLVIISMLLLNGCSYVQKWNPWAEDELEAKVQEANVNLFLWQASLDKLGFMPISEKNFAKGIIITDWYRESSNAKEQFKLEVRILSKELRTDGVQVKGQSRKTVNGKWQVSEMSVQTEQIIELSILKRARVLYQKSFNQ